MGELSQHKLLSPAVPPLTPISPNIQKTLVFSGLSGFLVGILYIIVNQFLYGYIFLRKQVSCFFPENLRVAHV